jgi:hypothetical protein
MQEAVGALEAQLQAEQQAMRRERGTLCRPLYGAAVIVELPSIPCVAQRKRRGRWRQRGPRAPPQC